jgi:hypothetical protein
MWMSLNVMWIIASLASGDGPVHCNVVDVATVCSSRVGRSLKISRSQLGLSLGVDPSDKSAIQANVRDGTYSGSERLIMWNRCLLYPRQTVSGPSLTSQLIEGWWRLS